MHYSLDTSAILDGWNRHYPPDVFPSLWDKLDELIDKGEIRAVDEVLHELRRKDDAVYKWAKQRTHLFLPLDEDIQKAAADILGKFQELVNDRKGRSSCDPFVIALAKVNGCVVITGESRTNKIKSPKIPDVCYGIGIKAIRLLDLIREQGWIFRV